MSALPLHPALVEYVLAHLRPADAAQVWPILPPGMEAAALAQAICSTRSVGRVFLHDGVPAAVLGATPRGSGSWDLWLFATDAWGQVWRQVLRYCRGPMEADLLSRGARCARAHSEAGWRPAQRVLHFLGFTLTGTEHPLGAERPGYDLWVRSA